MPPLFEQVDDQVFISLGSPARSPLKHVNYPSLNENDEPTLCLGKVPGISHRTAQLEQDDEPTLCLGKVPSKSHRTAQLEQDDEPTLCLGKVPSKSHRTAQLEQDDEPTLCLGKVPSKTDISTPNRKQPPKPPLPTKLPSGKWQLPQTPVMEKCDLTPRNTPRIAAQPSPLIQIFDHPHNKTSPTLTPESNLRQSASIKEELMQVFEVENGCVTNVSQTDALEVCKQDCAISAAAESHQQLCRSGEDEDPPTSTPDDQNFVAQSQEDEKILIPIPEDRNVLGAIPEIRNEYLTDPGNQSPRAPIGVEEDAIAATLEDQPPSTAPLLLQTSPTQVKDEDVPKPIGCVKASRPPPQLAVMLQAQLTATINARRLQSTMPAERAPPSPTSRTLPPPPACRSRITIPAISPEHQFTFGSRSVLQCFWYTTSCFKKKLEI